MPEMNDETSSRSLSQTAMVAGEVFLPGASELIAGDIGSGVGHFVATGLAVAVLGPTMPVLATVAAIGLRVNSYMLATKRSNVLRAMSDNFSRAVARETSHGERVMQADRRPEHEAPSAPKAKG